jgi:hypothetical protein
MSGWRAGLIALALGGVILAIGWVMSNNAAPTSTTGTGPVNADFTLACPTALELACDQLAVALDAGRGRYQSGEVPADTIVVTFTRDLPAGSEETPFARSPIAIAVWRERAGNLESACGGVDIACLVSEAGKTWDELGGLDTWGIFHLGLADPAEGIADLEAWRLIAAASPVGDLGGAVTLRADDGGQLVVDLVLIPTRADAVVTSEAAIASQLENASQRTGRLMVFYPDPSPYLSISFVAEGGSARRAAERLLTPDLQAMLGSLGLRPLTGEATDLLRDLGTPGAEMEAVADAEKAALVDSWNSLIGG